jgi:Transposase
MATISIGSLLSFAPWASDQQIGRISCQRNAKRELKIYLYCILTQQESILERMKYLSRFRRTAIQNLCVACATFTRDLHALADWLQRCHIESVAMESTSVYWIPLYQILENRGIEVFLVNAQHVKNVPGRKTDVSDCQWLQYLHSVGLLRASFRPPGTICALRSLWRHRGSLIQMAAEHVLQAPYRLASRMAEPPMPHPTSNTVVQL